MYGMGGMGGYGGMSSYGGLSGGLGSSYGSSYGNYGNRYGSTTTTKIADGKVDDPNNPNVDKQKQQQISQRRVIFEEWFKMMGGLQSVVQLGFSVIALASFCSKTSQIFKKLVEFSKQTSKSLGGFIESKIPTKLFTQLSSPEKRGKAIKSIVLMVIRVFAAILFCLGMKLRREIKKQAQLRKKEMQGQLQKIKSQEVQMVEQQMNVQSMQRENIQEANL